MQEAKNWQRPPEQITWSAAANCRDSCVCLTRRRQLSAAFCAITNQPFLVNNGQLLSGSITRAIVWYVQNNSVSGSLHCSANGRESTQESQTQTNNVRVKRPIMVLRSRDFITFKGSSSGWWVRNQEPANQPVPRVQPSFPESGSGTCSATIASKKARGQTSDHIIHDVYF
ncbi:uncharacterized protein BDV17DRAFT_230283 [Aspergillus undulatus]|uniref:uncharacterized protein n=1 Tax=Aspergillus undulatus TaxID=1810928 RepID=UPI003CCCA829